MLTEAAKQTNRVVRNPAEWPCSLRFRPIKVPATTVSASRKAISGHSIVIGIYSQTMVFGGSEYQQVLVRRYKAIHRLAHVPSGVDRPPPKGHCAGLMLKPRRPSGRSKTSLRTNHIRCVTFTFSASRSFVRAITPRPKTKASHPRPHPVLPSQPTEFILTHGF